MKIIINGKAEEIEARLNLADIISKKGLCAQNVVLEHNALIVPKDRWQDVILKENDSIEIVSFVGGG